MSTKQYWFLVIVTWQTGTKSVRHSTRRTGALRYTLPHSSETPWYCSCCSGLVACLFHCTFVYSFWDTISVRLYCSYFT